MSHRKALTRAMMMRKRRRKRRKKRRKKRRRKIFVILKKDKEGESPTRRTTSKKTTTTAAEHPRVRSGRVVESQHTKVVRVTIVPSFRMDNIPIQPRQVLLVVVHQVAAAMMHSCDRC